MAVAAYTANGGDVQVQNELCDHFNALTLDDDDEGSEDERAWEDMDHDINEGNFPKYVGVEVEEDIDIIQVHLKGDDRFQAMVLLVTMDDLMGPIKRQILLP